MFQYSPDELVLVPIHMYNVRIVLPAIIFLTTGKDISELAPSLFAKNKGGAGGKGGEKSRDRERARDIAAMETQIFKFAELLTEQRAATKENVERKQARTDLERDDSDNELSEEEPEDRRRITRALTSTAVIFYFIEIGYIITSTIF